MRFKIQRIRLSAYDPVIGRWLNRDPFPNAERLQGPDLYQYCLNNPMRWNDPLGLWAIDARALGGKLGSVLGDHPWSDHWQIFYNDGSSDGYHPQGISPSDPVFGPDPSSGPWTQLASGSDDCKMKQAEKNIQNLYKQKNITYNGLTQNCQDYIHDVLFEYSRLHGK